jgi:AraC family transcriptional regulator
MDWQTRMGNALGYLEAHLNDVLDVEAAAREANCSMFHFCRIFEVVTGIGPAEYVRRRRLSEAALELSAGGVAKLIEIALRFGYESPDAFSRAFRREFGCLPSEARRRGTNLHSYPPLAFQIVLKGDRPMEYRIEEEPDIELAGIGIRVNGKTGSNFKKIPAFWDEAWKDGRNRSLCKKISGKLGLCGVCRDFEMDSGDFTYSIAVNKPASMEGMPAGSEVFTVPACTWGKFTVRGPFSSDNFQATVKRIFGEWLPASEWEHAGTAEIEYYSEGDMKAADYVAEYWIPLKKGK